jgi:hypothetical protein
MRNLDILNQKKAKYIFKETQIMIQLYSSEIQLIEKFNA